MAEKLDLDEMERSSRSAIKDDADWLYGPSHVLTLIARIRELESRATEAEATGKQGLGMLSIVGDRHLLILADGNALPDGDYPLYTDRHE